MGANHPHAEFIGGATRAAAIPPVVKVSAALAFVFAVVATPRGAWPTHGVQLAVLVVALRCAAVPARFALVRLRIVAPFLAAAATLPWVARGERIDVLGVAVSRPGTLAAATIATKTVLGLGASIALSATTEPVDILRGLDRLRVPRACTAIAGFMVRYGELLRAESNRLQIARVARGDDPRAIWQARAIARTAGTMFVRSYERGERVHLAMAARGYTGSFPRTEPVLSSADDWLRVWAFPATAWLATAFAWMVV